MNKNEIKFVIHLADIHIRTFNRHKEYREIFVDLITKIKSVLSGKNPDECRIVVAGDIVHQKIQISNEQLMLTKWLFEELSTICELVIIAGNHDMLANNKDRMDSISPLVDLMNNPKIKYLTKSDCYQDNNIIWCVYSVFEDNKRPDIDAAKVKFGSNVKYIGLYHAPLAGAKTETGYEFEHSDNIEIFDGLDAVMCGDIHLRQTIKGPIPIIYPGSVIQQTFGEKVKGHGFVLWRIETLEYSGFDIKNKYSMFQFKIESINDIDNDAETLING